MSPSPPPPACKSKLVWDTKFEECQTFCNPREGSTHCQQCKCKACGFCQALSQSEHESAPGGGECSSAFVADSAVAGCAAWCNKPDHPFIAAFDGACEFCACRSCTLCRSAASGGDVPPLVHPTAVNTSACSLGPQLLLTKLGPTNSFVARVLLQHWCAEPRPWRHALSRDTWEGLSLLRRAPSRPFTRPRSAPFLTL